jgi:hypothetical protein
MFCIGYIHLLFYVAFNTITAEQVKGANIVPGRKQDQTAYRAELGGILGAVITTKEICKQNDIERGATVIGCDCEGAIKALWEIESRRVGGTVTTF